MTDPNNQHPFAMTEEDERYFLQKHLGGGQALPRPAGSVPDEIEVQLGVITDFFDKHNADEIQWDALDRLRESIPLILNSQNMEDRRAPQTQD